jgi:hypothetical protein
MQLYKENFEQYIYLFKLVETVGQRGRQAGHKHTQLLDSIHNNKSRNPQVGLEQYTYIRCHTVLRSRSIFVRLRLQLVKHFGSGSSLSNISAPAPACQKFRLRLQLVKNFGSGSDIFPIYFRKKSKIFMVSKKFHAFENQKRS